VTEQTPKMPKLVTCEHSLSLLQDYLDGTLSPEAKAELDLHFKACPPCIDFVKKFKATPKVCKRALAAEMPKDMSDRLMGFLRQKTK
jgi:anti-sigma factor RsiW